MNQWREANKAVDELFKQHEWVESAFVVLGKGVVKTASWGVLWRVTASAVFSVADVGTDCYVAYDYYKTGRMDYFKYTVGSIAAAMLIQLILVLVQYNKKGILRILRETIFIVTGMKSPWDAYKVASGRIKEEETVIDPMMEVRNDVATAANSVTISDVTNTSRSLQYIGSKCINLFAESIPGIIIQLSAMMTQDRALSVMQIASVLVSALTSGFTSAQISYDFDTDPYTRRAKPDFYGYVPDKSGKRTVLFMTMITMSAAMLLCRSFTLVLFILSEPWYLLGFLCLDMAVFLGLKVFRKGEEGRITSLPTTAVFFTVMTLVADFIYWAPLKGYKKLVVSVLMRVMIKVITDFTGVIQFRHPSEVGGLQWTIGYLSTTGFLPMGIVLYESVLGPRAGLRQVGGALSGFSALIFLGERNVSTANSTAVSNASLSCRSISPQH